MYMRIWCERCGGEFELYSRDDIRSHKARTCPHCQERVGAEAWAKTVDAFEACKRASMALFDDSTSKTRFTVDFIDDSIYKNYKMR